MKRTIAPENLAVVWFRGGRVGSVTKEEMSALKQEFCCSLIQTDVSGCEHWTISGKWPRKPRSMKRALTQLREDLCSTK